MCLEGVLERNREKTKERRSNQFGSWKPSYSRSRTGCSVAVCQPPAKGWLDQGGTGPPCKLLANLLHRLVERGPFFFQALVFDLAQLSVANLETLGHDLIGAANARPEILGSYQVPENIAALLQRETLGCHVTPLP